jgi:hypothetical protein
MVSEGQRKAHYEELDGEKKRNKDRIKQLEKVIEDLHVQLSSTGQVCLLCATDDSNSAVPEPLSFCGHVAHTFFSKGQSNALIFFSLLNPLRHFGSQILHSL